ncbi:MAG: tRNA (adenosine(37)-N6)-dimethylallyltransferase MiaA [Chloroflexi bacterium]|nr:tRNA (adenosine(37)-N6)-dimethylallyltransferase MiaA [Chloroflexota bacterium]
MTKLLVIVGPTAVGKTALAVRLAQQLRCEAVSADSRQIYRGMDIGTAKPTPAEQAALRHHLIDVVAPDEVLPLPGYLALAQAAIKDISARGALPILVGGTGQYVRALLEGWNVPEVPPNPGLRSELLEYAEREGAEALHQRLNTLDPAAAARIDYRNVRRVVRALEVHLTLGQPISALQTKRGNDYEVLMLGLTLPRETLYTRADARIDAMLAAGLVAEVEALLAAGYSHELPAMSGLGYRQIAAHLRGEMPMEEAITRFKNATHRYIRQQYSWFSLQDTKIAWHTAGEGAVEEIETQVHSWASRA